MRRAILAVFGVLALGCSQGVSVSPDELRSHGLTEDEIRKFVQTYPKVEHQLSGALADQDPKLLLSDPYLLFSRLRLDRDVVKALRAEGYSDPREFLLVMGSLLPAYYKVKAQEELSQLEAQLHRMQEDTLASPEAVDSLASLVDTRRRALAELKYEVKKENLELVKAHLSELEGVLE